MRLPRLFPLFVCALFFVGLYVIEGTLQSGAYFPTLLKRHCLIPAAEVALEARCRKKQDGKTVPYFIPESIYHTKHSLRPLAGPSNKEVLVSRETGEWVSYQSDRHGFSNPDRIWDVPKHDLILLGDSFTLGCCQPKAARFSTLIREAVPNTLNLAQLASGPLLSLAQLKEYGRPAKTVVFFYYEGNDLSEFRTEFSDPVLRRYLEVPAYQQDLTKRQNEIDDLIALTLQDQLDRFDRKNRFDWEGLFTLTRFRAGLETLYRNVRPILGRWRHGPIEPPTLVAQAPRNDWQAPLQRTIQGLVDQIRAGGGKAYLYYLPNYLDLNRKGAPIVLKLAKQAGFHVVEMGEVFDTNNVNPYLAEHYSAEANALIAKHVLATIGQGELG